MEFSLVLINIGLIVVVLLGAGATLVGLPGNLMIFLAALGYGYWEHFIHVNSTFLLILFGIFVVGETAEFLAAALGAKRANASGPAVAAAIIGAIVGGIMGTGLLPLVGTVLGAMLGALGASFLVEFIKSGDVAKSKHVAINVAIGQITGMLFKLAVAIGMAAAIMLQLPWV